MTENLERLRVLLLKYSTKNSSEVEEKELYALLDNSAEEDVEPLLANILEDTEPFYDSNRRERILASILKETQADSPSTIAQGESIVVSMKPRFQIWKRIAVAASIVGLLFVGYWLMNRKTTADGQQTTVIQANDVQAPEKNRAQIKLADGRIVYLDSVGNGELANVNGVKVVKNANGEIVYETTGPDASTSLSTQYNTMFNPRGSKVQPLVLDDGTKVWLNAESSITYPTAFVGTERRVEISGEAYFEVAKDAGKKFYVTGAGVTTEVLGTHFNVNTFKDDGVVRVTLLEGNVNVSTKYDVRGTNIKPGEQAFATTGNNQLAINKNADIEQVMAWKNGRFKFGGTSIEVIMQQIARWYDVEIEYRGKITETFGGGIDRQVNVSEVLKKLELTGEVHFVIEGKKIIVKP